MENHFIKNISFENFKCFKKLEFDGFKRVNLIGGHNNVGKTSFMEGVDIAVCSDTIISLTYKLKEMIRNRQNSLNDDFEIDFFYNDFIYFNIIKNINNIKVKHVNNNNYIIEESFLEEFDDELKDSKKYSSYFLLSVNEKNEKIYLNYFIRSFRIIKEDLKYISNFVHTSKMGERDIAVLYGNLINLSKEDYLDKSLQIFDNNIVGFRQILKNRNEIVLKLKLKDIEKPILLSSFGEGINRYIAIICAIWASKDGYLFIDEIENGIHYTNYPKLWKLIFDISKEANCQIFAATHSKECIEAFNNENKNNEGLYLEFYRNQKTGLINIKDRDNEQLEYALLNNGEFRGE
ncbi:AAA family ATPase [uncultured Brachyspira sp.]|uniref:AAA family ATPase n=1 Tax=uncultured Brachyspira sp. TaxID=221953 RepID=UPI002626797B|nr:AAA family ATPase [uncultured Brachyspira sp.]